MQTIYLDSREFHSAQDVHAALKLLLDLPAYYGGNADALHDCLSERLNPVSIALRGQPEGDAAAALGKVKMVVEDLGGDWKEL